MSCPTIMAILVDSRRETATKVQEILTKYGCIIRVRLGLHETEACSDEGLIILQLCAPEIQVQQLRDELNALGRVKAEVIKLALDD
ncbi:MAG: hypothetical protein IMW96_04855 [Thermoanaerobacteraceae bacterium]|nr:hypothetical protein [Thermoanaerobacteraceae bacterium]